MKKATAVPPSGDRKNCLLAGVGEQPGRTEVHTRKVFSGPAGTELTSCFVVAKISRLQCYLTNVIKDLDLPLDQYIKFGKTSVSISDEGRQYIQMLKEELIDCSANVILAIGNVALYALTNRRGIMNWRGSVLESTLVPGKKVVPIIHPATVIPPKNVYLNKRLIIFDLIKARNEAEFPEFRLGGRNITISPSYYDSLAFLNLCHKKGSGGAIIDFDIEVYNNEVSCISFAHSPYDAISIPFIDSRGDYFTIEQEAMIWKSIASILEDVSITKRAQNAGFDWTMLLSIYGIKTCNVHDTMVAQKILFPDYPMGLDFITSTHTDIPYYKADGKRWFKVGGAWETLWHYNGMDSIACAASFPEQLRQLEQQGNFPTYKRQLSIIEPLVYMMNRGIKVDTEGMLDAKVEMEDQLVDLQKQLNSLAGMELNANSFNQLKWYFYEKLGHKAYRKKGSVTTDETALKRLSRKGVKEASIVGKIRTLRKLSSAYVNLDKVDFDGRIRCSYNPVGTKTGRLSSSENIFGTGMNMQNWPHKLLKHLLADEGYIYYSFDLSQGENRIVAYVGKIPRMIDAFETGKDVHDLTSALILGKTPEEVSHEDGSSPLGDGSHSERFWGKKANHSLNYDLGYKEFSLRLEMPETEGKWMVDRYHSIYPEVRGNYHQMIKTQLAKDRTLTNLFGRKRLFLQQWGDNLFKDAYAQIPQSTIADKIDEQGLAFIYQNQQWFKSLELLIQVHDSIGFQIPLNIPWSEHADMLIRIKESLETPVKWGDVEFVIPADLVMGFNLYKKEGIEFKHDKFPESSQLLAKELEEGYNKLMKGKKDEE